MRIEKITFMQTFPTGQFANQKLGVEIEIEDTHPSTGESNHDAAMDAFKEAKELVNNAFHKMNPGIELQVYYSELTGHQMNTQSAEDKRTEAIIKDIEETTSISEINKFNKEVGLLAYQSAADSHYLIKVAYDLKMLQLKKHDSNH